MRAARPLGAALLRRMALVGGAAIMVTGGLLAFVAGQDVALWSVAAGGLLLLLLLATLRHGIARWVTDPLRQVGQDMAAHLHRLLDRLGVEAAEAMALEHGAEHLSGCGCDEPRANV